MHFLSKVSCGTALALACAGAVFAQSKVPSPQPPTSVAQAPTYNPALAAHDVEVGKYYMNRDDVDGAIARYKDALLHKPNYAEPCLLLGQAYEKKNDAATAIAYYQKYLKILPKGSESKKLRKRIAELQEKVKKEAAASSKSTS
jgi:tetratricopeptide (TPR) repeat protein